MADRLSVIQFSFTYFPPSCPYSFFPSLALPSLSKVSVPSLASPSHLSHFLVLITINLCSSSHPQENGRKGAKLAKRHRPKDSPTDFSLQNPGLRRPSRHSLHLGPRIHFGPRAHYLPGESLLSLHRHQHPLLRPEEQV